MRSILCDTTFHINWLANYPESICTFAETYARDEHKKFWKKR